MQVPSLSEGKLPVFVFPTNLAFYSDDQSTHKQVITLYNPYDFTIKFKILSTSPRKYNVVDAEGVAKSRCCVDIVVRHKDICVNNEGVRDKFRIQTSEYGQKSVLGRRDVSAVLLPTKDKASVSAEETFEHLPSSASSQASVGGASFSAPRAANGVRGGGLPSGPNWIIISAAVLCIAALMLPTSGDAADSSLPAYLYLSLHQKLIAAYILGLVTMAILRS